LRTEFFNVFTTPTFTIPSVNCSLDGVTVNPDFGNIKSAHDARQIQFAARFKLVSRFNLKPYRKKVPGVSFRIADTSTKKRQKPLVSVFEIFAN